MTRYLLDSDAIMDHFAGYPPTVELLRRLDEEGEDLCVCAVVIAEVYSGLRPERVPEARALLDRCLYLNTSALAARHTGEWRRLYRSQGVQIQTTDALIAATALEHDATVVTGNVRDYPMRELSVLALDRLGRRR